MSLLTPGVATKVVSASCGLSAFSIAIIAGLAVDNPFEDIVSRALVGLLVGHIVGFVVGSICERTIADAISQYKSARPVNPSKRLPDGGDGSATTSAPIS
jgi:tetrahydromethanopterin S-methyltransferase subunit C